MGIGEFFTVYYSTVAFIYTGEHISSKVREQYLAAILRQNIAFFDKLGAGEVTTRITADTNLIQDGLSEKISLTLTAITTFLTAFVIGFIKSWKLTLILMSTIFAITIIMGAGSRFTVRFNKVSLEAYAVGGSVAEEVMSSIRNTTAFSTQSKLAKQYDSHLAVAEKWGFKQKAVLSGMVGCMMCIIYMNYVSKSPSWVEGIGRNANVLYRDLLFGKDHAFWLMAKLAFPLSLLSSWLS